MKASRFTIEDQLFAALECLRKIKHEIYHNGYNPVHLHEDVRQHLEWQQWAAAKENKRDS